MHSLLTGDLTDAFAQNPLTVLFLPFLGYATGWWLVRPWAGGQLPRPDLPPRAATATLVLILAFWILRNLTAFSFLAPIGP